MAPLAHAAAKPAVETTGVASRPASTIAVRDQTAAAVTADCDEEAWPYITRECLAKRDAERGRVRVITTDRIEPRAPAAFHAERAAKASLPVPVAAPEPPAAMTTAVDTPTEISSAEAVPLPLPRPEVVNETAEKVSPASSKRARNARNQREQGRLRRAAQALRQDGIDDDAHSARPRGRVVERWTEREYVVPSERGLQRRRVIVRSGGHPPGPFGATFGTVFR